MTVFMVKLILGWLMVCGTEVIGSMVDLEQASEQAHLKALQRLTSFDPREKIGNCTKVSKTCRAKIRQLTPKWDLIQAYANYTLHNKKCVGDFIGQNCWNEQYGKWKQGKCQIDDTCMEFHDQLEAVCVKNGGILCDGEYKFGIGGSYVTIMLPTCAPQECDNDHDMKKLSQCIDDQTCGALPGEVVTACQVDFGCYSESKFTLHLTFGLLFGFLGCLALAFLVGNICSCGSGGDGATAKIASSSSSSRSKSKKRVRLNEDRNLGGESRGLLDELGVNVPLTVDSQGSSASAALTASGFEDVLSIGQGTPRDFIVEGTPQLLNTQSIPQVAGAVYSPGDLDTDFLSAGGSSGNGEQATPGPHRFKLSTQFERHIIRGFMFRREELHGKGSGWGTGSTAASSLVWRSVFYKKKQSMILKGVSGFIKPGMCIAFVGAPDSGATTLLKVLAQRTTGGTLNGEILVDGYPPDAKFKRIMAYIPKEDLNLPVLTVRETLEFSLNLRAPMRLPQKLRKERIDVILSLLGLSHVADTIVGDQLVRGISGGEKRRVSLGVELVVGRSLLLSSQPTNGLDSSAAYDVIKATRALADTGLAAFACTLSQAGPELLKLFDTICLVSRGTVIYFGPMKEAERYFYQLGYVCPSSKSVSDFLEEMTGDAEQFFTGQPQYDALEHDQEGKQGQHEQQDGEQQQHQQQIDEETDESGQAKDPTASILSRKESMARLSLVQAFRKSGYYKKLLLGMFSELDQASLERERQEREAELHEIRAGILDVEDGFCTSLTPSFLADDDGVPICCGPSAYTTGFWYQLAYLIRRQVLLVLRSPTIKVKFGRAVFQGCLIGTMFYQLDFDQQGANSRFGLMYLSIASVVFGAMAAIPELFAQREIYYAQKSAGYFRPMAYMNALLIVEIPLIVAETFVYSIIMYMLSGLQGGIISWNYLYFWMTIISMQLMSWTLCLMIIMASPSAVVAQAICPTFIAIFSLFCGYLVPKNQLYKPMRWLWDISPLSRSLKGLAINEVTGLSYYCTEDQLFPPSSTPLLDVPAPNGYNGPAYRTCPLSSGDATLFLYNYDEGEQDKWALLITNLVFPIAFLFGLTFVVQTIHYEADSSDSAGQIIESRKRAMRKKLREQVEREALSHDYQRLEEASGSGQFRARGTSLPGAPKISGSVEFHNLNYSVEIPQGRCRPAIRKQLLFDISGFAETGKITALMGASGAGKSTLLDVLAQKKTGGFITTEVLLANGKPIDQFYPRFAAYVEQMDSHLPTQTVREAVEASALLRLPSEVLPDDRQALVNQIIGQLNLQPFENSYIGSTSSTGSLEGVSPEVRKKCTIAVELAMDPCLIYLDEPTTGLDSKSALAVMQAVKDACANKASLCTIHQPSAEVFALFDEILLLQTGGRVVYFGAIAEMIDYFTRYSFVPYKEGQNPADYALVCSRMCPSGHSSAADVWDHSKEKTDKLANAPRHRTVMMEGYGQPSPYGSPFAASSYTQFKQLLYTQFYYLGRNTALMKIRVSTAIFFGMIIGILFFDSDTDVAGAQARVALCFISITYVGYSAMLAIPITVEQRPVHFREYTSNMYRLVPYFVAITLAEIPFILLQNFCYIVTFYFLVGLRTEVDKVLLFCFGMFMLNLACSAFSGFIAMIAPNSDSGTIINNISNSVFTLFCGFLLPYESIPVYYKPLYYLSEFRYPLSFLISNELQGRNFSCPNNERAIPIFVGGLDKDAPPPPYGNGRLRPSCALDLILKDPQSLLQDPYCFRYFCPVDDGDALLNQYNFPTDEAGKFAALSMMIVFYLLWRGLALLSLKYIQHIKR